MNTACNEFENLLAGYDGLQESERTLVDAHVAHCGNCRALAQALSDLGTALGAEYGEVCAPPSLLEGFGRQVSRDPLPKPSPLPAILDMVASTAVVGAASMLLWFASPVITFTGPMLYATAGILTLSGLGITLWALRENEG